MPSGESWNATLSDLTILSNIPGPNARSTMPLALALVTGVDVSLLFEYKNLCSGLGKALFGCWLSFANAATPKLDQRLGEKVLRKALLLGARLPAR